MNKKPKAFFVVSAWNNDVSWVEEYTDDYIVYDKSHTLPVKDKIVRIENIGYNTLDILNFITDNYTDLPELTAFLEGNPFDHCKREVFDKLIYRRKFTPVEYYGTVPANSWERRTESGGFLEINNSWYIEAVNQTFNQTCIYKSFDEFMNIFFVDYQHLEWLRFSPGAQYIVPRKHLLNYPVQFWTALKNGLYSRVPTEAHVIERAFYYIFKGLFTARKIGEI